MAIGTPVALGSASNTATGTSVALTTTGSSPAGASILCAVTVNNGAAVLSSVTDSAGNTYAVDITRNRGGSSPYVAIASCHNAAALAAGGTITATFTASLTQAKTVVAQSVTGLATSGTLDRTGSNSGTAANTWTSGTTGTLAQADEILLSVAMNSGGRTNTPATNWTELADALDADSVAYVVQYRIVSATTALDEGGTLSGSANYSAAVATYKGSSGAATVAASTSSATADGDPVTVLAGATVDAGTASATADGPTAIIMGAAGVAASSASATADGDAAAVSAGAVIDAGSAEATASGDTAAAVTGATVLGGPAEATAASDSVVIGAGHTETAGAGDATAGGDTVVVMGSVGIAAGSAEATASGDDVDVDVPLPGNMRRFDDSGDKITLAMGDAEFAFGPGTIAVIRKSNSDANQARVPVHVGTPTSGTARYGMQLSSGTDLSLRCGANLSIAPTIKATVADGLCLLVVRKGDGSVPPRFSKYEFDTDEWTHEDAAAGLADSALPTGNAYISGWSTTTGWDSSDMGIAAIWDRELSDADVEKLVQAESEWALSAPVVLWPLDQPDTSTPVADEADSASQTAITGTTVIPGGIPWTGGIVEVVADPGELYADGDAVVVLVDGVPFAAATVVAGPAGAYASGSQVLFILGSIIGPPVGGSGGSSGSGVLLPGTTGVVGPVAHAHPGYFRITLTNLYRPASVDGSRAQVLSATLARLDNFKEAEVSIPLNDAREAKVKISMHDPAALHVFPAKTMLHIVYVTPTAARLVFWGPLTQPQWNSEEESVTLNAVDPSIRLRHHYIRIGDQILNRPSHAELPNPYGKGYIPFDGQGLRMLRDCGDTISYPALGIMDGDFDAMEWDVDTTHKGKFSRGAEVWATWLEIISHQAAPDFELLPIDHVQGYYCQINTFDLQGNADPSGLILQDGFGLGNCRMDYTPGGKIVTHAHVLSEGDQRRVTVADQDSALEHGAYIQWESTQYKQRSNQPLIEKGKQLIAAYGRPPEYFQVRLAVDSDLYFGEDFYTGDALTASVRRGYLQRSLTGRLVKTTLRQIDDAGNVVPEIEVAADPGQRPGEFVVSGDGEGGVGGSSFISGGSSPVSGGGVVVVGGGSGDGEPPSVPPESADPPPPPDGGVAMPAGDFTTLVLDEQFTSPLAYPDSAVWLPYNGPGHAGNGLRDPAAFEIVSNQLVVTAWWDGSRIHSGGMRHRRDYLYGRFEVRIKTEFDPTGQMSGLALTWPQSERWPYDGELDWYETGNNLNADRNPFYSYLHHYRGTWGGDQTRFVHYASATDWHVMTMDWSPDEIAVYRDGVLVNRLTDATRIPAVPHHMCLQLDAFSNSPLAGPVKMYVDYARIWV